MHTLDEKFFCYKGKPLVRSGDTIYYGSMTDDYVAILNIKDTVEVDGRTTPNGIVVQLIRTDKNISPKDAVVKKSEKQGLYNALDIADIWLTRFLAE